MSFSLNFQSADCLHAMMARLLLRKQLYPLTPACLTSRSSVTYTPRGINKQPYQQLTTVGKSDQTNANKPTFQRAPLTTVSRSNQSNVFGTPLQQPPLAVLPISVLLRSLLISIVSSKSYLLHPSLFILSYFTKPNRPWLFDVDRNPVLHWVLKRAFYVQFCGGENRQEVQALGEQMKAMGISGTILTYAKETVFDSRAGTELGMGTTATDESKYTKCASVEAWRIGTLETAHMLMEGDQLALKYFQ